MTVGPFAVNLQVQARHGAWLVFLARNRTLTMSQPLVSARLPDWLMG